MISEDQVEHVHPAGILAVAMELVIGNVAVITVDPARTVLVDVALIGMADTGDRDCDMGCQRCARPPRGRGSRRSATVGRRNPLQLRCAGSRTWELPLIFLWRGVGLMPFGVNVQGFGR